MSDGVLGKDVLVSIGDGQATETMLEIEQQGDATYNPGTQQNIKKNKNGALPYDTESGATVTFTMDKVRPLSAGQARVYEVAASKEAVNVEYNDSKPGGHKRAGLAKVTLGEETANTEGVVQVGVTIGFVGDPTTTVNP